MLQELRIPLCRGVQGHGLVTIALSCRWFQYLEICHHFKGTTVIEELTKQFCVGSGSRNSMKSSSKKRVKRGHGGGWRNQRNPRGGTWTRRRAIGIRGWRISSRGGIWEWTSAWRGVLWSRRYHKEEGFCMFPIKCKPSFSLMASVVRFEVGVVEYLDAYSEGGFPFCKKLLVSISQLVKYFPWHLMVILLVSVM